MNRRALWKISIGTTPDAEDAVSQLLENIFGQPASSYTHFETGATSVTVHLTEKPLLDRGKRAEIAAHFRTIETAGLDIGAGKVTLAKVRPENWAESWKRHFKPLRISSGLLIRPSWSKNPRRAGQIEVVLDPGLSFGTGHHPTTAFCLKQIVSRRRRGEKQSFLDIGTGSGILAIAAARFGYGPVRAIDYDEEAVRTARANARQNRVSHRIEFLKGDVAKLSSRPQKKYDFVCANLISNLLMEQSERILAQLRPEGGLVIAGILKEEFAAVQKAYEDAGLGLIIGKTEKEWRSGCFGWRDKSLASALPA